MAATRHSILDIVRNCNCVAEVDTLLETEALYRFIVNGKLVGLVNPQDIAALEKAVASGKCTSPFVVDSASKMLTFTEQHDTRDKRSAAVASLLSVLRSEHAWRSLGKWRNELYPVYGDSEDAEGVALMVERASSYNFGIRTFGVHINGIVTDPASGEVKMWVAKRSLQKQTWPGYLDQFVAGGIGNGASVWESVIKECEEEGGVPRNIAERTKFAGTIQYYTRSDLGLQPETQFVFDLELPKEFEPYPNDGEVDSFYLWPLDVVIDKLRKNLFKPNCAVCVVDFLIRHGHLTPDNEPDYLEIIDNIHRPLPYPGPKYIQTKAAPE
ncbi:hypothetical protein GQ54DRAFT_298493 [Martensiomyces pterosporus]|nr:hypothetical protein GQ54DRAFT_298493 [Martensiomyces pterosporus]